MMNWLFSAHQDSILLENLHVIMDKWINGLSWYFYTRPVQTCRKGVTPTPVTLAIGAPNAVDGVAGPVWRWGLPIVMRWWRQWRSHASRSSGRGCHGTVWWIEWLYLFCGCNMLKQFLWQVGVGISGKEGRLVSDDKQVLSHGTFCSLADELHRQAVNSADFAISQFRLAKGVDSWGMKPDLLTAMSKYFNVIREYTWDVLETSQARWCFVPHVFFLQVSGTTDASTWTVELSASLYLAQDMLHGRKHFNPGSQCCQNFARQVCDLQLLEECCEPRPHLKTKSQQQLSASVSNSFMWFPFSMRLRLAWNLASWRNTTPPQKKGRKPEATQVLLMFYYTFVSGYAGHGFPNLDSYGWWFAGNKLQVRAFSKIWLLPRWLCFEHVCQMNSCKWYWCVHSAWAAWCCKGPCILQFCPGSTDHHNWGVWSGISQHMSLPFSRGICKVPLGWSRRMWLKNKSWLIHASMWAAAKAQKWMMNVRYCCETWYALMCKCQRLQGLQEIECQTWQIEKNCLLPTVRAFVCKKLVEAWISMLRSWSGGQRVQTDLLVEGFSQRMIDLGSCISCISRARWDRNAPFRSRALMCDWLRWQPRLRSWWDSLGSLLID